jgi:PAS domain S-box-containing protein
MMNSSKTSSPLRILLVEDDEYDRVAFRRSLQKSEVYCEVTECIQADEARERLRTEASLFDLVVIDHGLPGMSGLELCKELLGEKISLPLVILTGKGSEQLAVEALKAGVKDYIIKDAHGAYLNLLPVVLPEVVQSHGDRIARKEAEKALREAHHQLEQRVKKRTAKLTEITKQLKLELTERRRAETELRESEEKYRTLFNYDPNSIFVLGLETLKILDANARSLEVYGYEKEELIGKSFLDLGAGEYSDGVLSETAPAVSTLCGVYRKVQHRRKDGTTFFVNVYTCQTKQSGKDVVIATTVDITESLLKERELVHASKMSTLGEMATGVAHELNQPLSTIQIGTDLLRNMIKEGEKIPDSELALVSEQMAEQVVRAVHIINHLRQFGRKAQIQPERVDINEPLEGVFTLLSQQLKLRGIRVVLDLTEDLPPIMGDINRLEQVFIDLVMNARDAMEEKQRQLGDSDFSNTLTVRSFKENSQVVVTITDTGTGIPDEIREKIFEPFFTTKKVGEGTGLGLSISYGIVQDYNGMIEVESEVGKGSTFKMSFPAYEEEEGELHGYV